MLKFKCFVMFSLFCIIIPNLINANDTLLQKQIGGNEYKLVDTQQIRIENEILTINIYDDYFDVEIEYDFINEGSEIIVEMGFPIYQYIYPTEEIDEKNKIRNFKSLVNGNEAEIEIVLSKITISKREEITAFYKKQVKFDKNSHSKVINSYTSSYENSYGNASIEYLVGSAITWKLINNLTIRTIIHSQDLYFNYFPELNLKNNQLSNKTSVVFEPNKRIYEQQYNKPQIELNSKFLILLGHTSYNWVYGLPWDYDLENIVYPVEGYRMLTNDQLRLSRNLIFAWHGYKFNDLNLREFFNKTAWYDDRIILDFDKEKFNDNELKNLEIIKLVEAERK